MVSTHEENIVHLLPAPIAPEVKPSRYVSKFSCQVGKERFEMGASKRLSATMGLPNGNLRADPEKFLRKNLADRQLSDRGTTQKWEKLKTKPPLPDKNDRPVMGLVSDKDYVALNAVEAILSKPPEKPTPVRWTERRGFGQPPSYIKQKPDNTKTTERSIASRQEEGWRVLSTETRLDLLRRLKIKWASINDAYQKLTFTLDTPAKKKRKESLEQLLTETEKDIRLLESSEHIVVSEN